MENLKAPVVNGHLESFVTAQQAADFLAITKRRILELARQGQIPAHPIGNGMRKTWRFRLSEIVGSLQLLSRSCAQLQKQASLITGQPRRAEES